MKILNKLSNSLVLVAVAMALGLSTVMSSGIAAAAQIPYDPNGTPTSNTPVFNQFTNVPNGVGDESQFVRIRPSTGDVTSTANNASYTNSLNTVCNTGDKFDVRTYIHNGADPNYNLNGTGSAVAHNVAVAQAAPLNVANTSFAFTSTVTASNAATVSDTGTLNCGNKQVKLSMVPGTVKTYSKTLGYNSESDSAVNGSLRVGSRVHGSGDQWACWDDRIIVVYAVVVQEIPTPKPVTATCDVFKIETGDNRTVRVSQFKYTATNAAYKNTVVSWDSNDAKAVTSPITNSSQVVGQTHQYNADGTYLLTATVSFSSADSASVPAADTQKCQQKVTFKAQTPPVVTTTVVTPTPPTAPTPVAPALTPAPVAVAPTTLVNTGAGSVAGLFAATTLFGAVAYRRFVARRLV